jgi:hypothetical protein
MYFVSHRPRSLALLVEQVCEKCPAGRRRPPRLGMRCGSIFSIDASLLAWIIIRSNEVIILQGQDYFSIESGMTFKFVVRPRSR